MQGVDDEWDKFGSFEEYDIFIKGILERAKRVLKPNGTIWVISTYHSVFRIGRILQDLGFWILNDVIWVKTNPMPNWLGVRFTNATETLIWAARDRGSKGVTFNREQAKGFGIGKVGANVWVMPLCARKERLRSPEGGKMHSTQKPAELLRRIILTTTRKGDLVVDPTAEVGTTGAVARSLERDFIMIEINPRYTDGIMERLEKDLPPPNRGGPIKEL